MHAINKIDLCPEQPDQRKAPATAYGIFSHGDQVSPRFPLAHCIGETADPCFKQAIPSYRYDLAGSRTPGHPG